MPYDLLIENATIVDGTGRPAYGGSVAIQDGRLAAIGDAEGAARRVMRRGLLLVAIGTFLFLGEWLFGSMAWGILHGTLFLALLCVPIGINLAGGPAIATIRGVASGLAVTTV